MPAAAVCHWDDVYHGDTGFVATRAVVHKATEGLSYRDPSYVAGIEAAVHAGHNAFGYHAFHTGNPKGQAALAHSVIGDFRPAMLDWERWRRESGSPAGLASLAEGVEFVTEFRRLGGVMHVIYLPRSAWLELGSPSLKPLAALGLRIQNADYRKGSDLATSAAFKPYGGMTPFANQYTDEPHDQNIAHMTWAQAKSIWHTGK